MVPLVDAASGREGSEVRYLVRCPDPEGALAVLGADAAGCVLDHDLAVVSAELERSPLYHRVKRSQAEGAPILVAPLADDPKMKGMAAGSHACLQRLEDGSLA
jgi:hypothetical protein